MQGRRGKGAQAAPLQSNGRQGRIQQPRFEEQLAPVAHYQPIERPEILDDDG